MRDALADGARGEVYQPLRTVIRPDGAAGLMALMPCYLPGPEAWPGAPGGPDPGGGFAGPGGRGPGRRGARLPGKAGELGGGTWVEF